MDTGVTIVSSRVKVSLADDDQSRTVESDADQSDDRRVGRTKGDDDERTIRLRIPYCQIVPQRLHLPQR